MSEVIFALVLLGLAGAAVPLMRGVHEVVYAIVAVRGGRLDRLILGAGPTLLTRGRVELRVFPIWATARTTGVGLGATLLAASLGLVSMYLTLSAFTLAGMLAGVPMPRSVEPPTIHDITGVGAIGTDALRQGDVIAAVDGAPMSTRENLSRALAERRSDSVTLTIERAGDTLSIPVTPGEVDGLPILGVTLMTETPVEAPPIGEAWVAALRFPPIFVAQSLSGVTRGDLWGFEHAMLAAAAETGAARRWLWVMLFLRFGGIAWLAHLLPFGWSGIGRVVALRRRS